MSCPTGCPVSCSIYSMAGQLKYSNIGEAADRGTAPKHGPGTRLRWVTAIIWKRSGILWSNPCPDHAAIGPNCEHESILLLYPDGGTDHEAGTSTDRLLDGTELHFGPALHMGLLQGGAHRARPDTGRSPQRKSLRSSAEVAGQVTRGRRSVDGDRDERTLSLGVSFRAHDWNAGTLTRN